MTTKLPQNKEPQPVPLDLDDEVFFDHASGPTSGRVIAKGRHGATLVCDKGQQHRVTWGKIKGHKRRNQSRMRVLDQGEDGMIVEDARGGRRYITIPPESREDDEGGMMKGGQPDKITMLLKGGYIGGRDRMGALLKAGAPPRAGLQLQEKTDRLGRQEKYWVRPDEAPAGNKRQPAQQQQPQQRPAPHPDAKVGNVIQFKNGEHQGSGKVAAVGRDGVIVHDEAGGEHRVRHEHIGGKAANDGGEAKPDGAQSDAVKPIAPDKFVASDFARQHDQADVTPDHILSAFPEDTKAKLQEVADRVAKVGQTIDQHRISGEGADAVYSPERAEIHRKVLTEPWTDKEGNEHPQIMSAERIAAATPVPGEKPTFTILGGRGGSGKSSFKGVVYDPDKNIVLDADAIKERLPEYEGWNAAQVHEESSDLLETALHVLREAGVNVVLDATMKTAKSAVRKVQTFKDKGYRTEAHYMHLPRQEAAKRAVSRSLGASGRYIPVEVVLGNTSNEESFDQIRKMVDRWSFRDNNVPKGQPPRLISESRQSGPGAHAPLTKSDKSPIFLLCGKVFVRGGDQ